MFHRYVTQVPEELTGFHDTFLCYGSVCKSFLWIQVVIVAVEILCFWTIPRFVFTVTMEIEGGLLSPPCRWKYLVSLGKLMTQPGNEPMIQFWMCIPSLGESWGCRAELCLFSACEVSAVLARCPQFWIFKHSLGASPRPVPILWFICSMSDQADYLSHCRCLCLPYQNLYLSTLLWLHGDFGIT